MRIADFVARSCHRLARPVLAITLLTACASGSVSVRAQQAPPADQPDQKTFTIAMQHTTVLQVLDEIMKQAHASYILDERIADIKIGAIRLEHVPLPVALDAVIRVGQKSMTYSLEAGIYRIVAREKEGDGTARATSNPISPASEPAAQGQNNRSVTLNLNHVDLFTALKELFHAAGDERQYVLDPGLRNAHVTVNIGSEPFEQALKTVLASSDRLTGYSLANNVYSIYPRQMSASLVRQGVSLDDTIVNIDLERVNLYDALKLLFNQVHAQYSLDPSLQNFVITIHARQPFLLVLEAMLSAASADHPLTYHVENGVFSVVKKQGGQ